VVRPHQVDVITGRTAHLGLGRSRRKRRRRHRDQAAICSRRVYEKADSRSDWTCGARRSKQSFVVG
jgi:hypothetical protein